MKKYKCPKCNKVPETYWVITKTTWGTEHKNNLDEKNPKSIQTQEFGDDGTYKPYCRKCFYNFSDDDIIEE